MKHIYRTKSIVSFLRHFSSTTRKEKYLTAQEINEDGYLPFPEGFATAAVHAGHKAEEWGFHEMVPSIVLSANAKHTEPNIYKRFSYGRESNPTRDVLEKTLARLENGKYCFCVPSGMAAVHITIGLLKSGDHIVCGDDMYSGTLRALEVTARQFGIDVTMVDVRDLRNIETAVKKNTKLIWTETPTNPTLKVVDLYGLGKLGKNYNVLTVVDNTFSTSYLQRPLDMGVDIVFHSLTKFTTGHSDIIMGCVITSDEEVSKKLKFNQTSMGITPSPFDCYLGFRSLQSLEVRMKKHMENAYALATFLETHPKIKRVIYPGLKSHPQHQLSKEQTSGPNGMISFTIKGGVDEAKRLFRALRLVTLAGSLGGSHSLICLPYTMTHKSMSDELKLRLGITENLIRFSTGLENIEDLSYDLDQALNKM